MTTTPEKPGAEVKTKLVNVTIDGVEVSVDEGTLVIRAAEQIGVEIPRFCDHPLLEPVGACRQCLVEIPDAGNGRGFPKPQASCAVPVAEGMVVNTQATSKVADKAQQGQMEFLLINHPLDCPVCDKGGECPLQNQAMTNGRGDSRFAAGGNVKRTFPKPINLSPQILLDRERCILCQRCTRFTDEIAGDPFIALLDRGVEQQIGIAEDAPFLSYFAGNTIQICPVGALTSEDYRFRARPFDLVSTPSIAEHDACGSAIRVDSRRGKVMRRLAGNDPEVNEEWITDKDRFAFHYAQADTRLTYPQVRDDDTGELRPASWPEAFAVAARGLAGKQAGVLTGGRVSFEDALAYSTFARVALGTNDIDFRSRPQSAEETAFLTSVVSGVPHTADSAVTYADLDTAKDVVLVGFEPEDEAGTIFLRLRKSVRAGGTSVRAIATHTTRGLDKVDGTLIATAPGEEATAIRDLEDLDNSSVILVGERLATSPGALSAAAEVAKNTGAKLAWIPRRAGDRGAIEAGCLPTLLPGGRPVSDASARVDAAAVWGVESLPNRPGRSGDAIIADLGTDLDALVVGGLECNDLADPAAARAAIDTADFVVAIEVQSTEITAVADVVFPASPVVEKSGTFVTWEGRPRSFETVLEVPTSLTEPRILAGIAEEMGARLGFRTVDEVRELAADMGVWDGARPAMKSVKPKAIKGTGHLLSTWRQMLDQGDLQKGEPALAACARPAVCLLPASQYAELAGDRETLTVSITGDRGSLTLPAETADLPDGVVWLPTNSAGNGIWADLASPGSRVTVKGVDQ